MTLPDATDMPASGSAKSRSPRIRVAAIIVRDDKLLLVEHEKAGQHYWLLPGGGVDWGESLDDALAREVIEETGLTAKIGDLLLVSDAIAPDGQRHILQLCFACTITGGEIAQSQDPRVVGAKFVELTNLSDLDLRPPLADEIVQSLNTNGTQPIYTGPQWASEPDTP